MIKVIIVDDHPIVVTGIKQLIDATTGMQVVGTAFNAAECKKLLLEMEADIILLDINLPDISGIDLCLYLQQCYPALKIIALSGFTEYYYIQTMIQNGASGYLLKNSLPEEIISGIQDVYAGDFYLSDEVDHLLEKRNPARVKIFLTIRERDLLRLVVEGYTNKEIADKLFLGVETVNSYRKNLLLKLGVRNTAALVKLAVVEKLI
jgi:DNA-binding NarL/FixJ family response regulator